MHGERENDEERSFIFHIGLQVGIKSYVLQPVKSFWLRKQSQLFTIIIILKEFLN